MSGTQAYEMIFLVSSIMLASAGLISTYKSIINTGGRSNYPREGNCSTTPKIHIFGKINKYSKVSGASVGSLLHQYSGYVLSVALVSVAFSQILGLRIGQTFILIVLSISFLGYRISQHEKRVLGKYRELLEEQFPDFVETLALAASSGLSFGSSFRRASEETRFNVERKKKSNLHQNSDKLLPFSTFISKLPSHRNLWHFGTVSKEKFKSSHKKVNLSSKRIHENKFDTPLQRELWFMESQLKEGKGLEAILDEFSIRVNSRIVADFVDAVLISLARGTPLANLLNDHATMIRDSQRRALLERAGRAEVKMMVPIVFMLLPISVLFALWPSLQQLEQLVNVA